MMAMSAIGTLGEFIPGEDVDSYMERFEFFCKANNIAEDMKVAAFISVVGKEAYEILRHHCDPNEKRFKEIVALFKQHLGSSSPAEENEDAQGPEGEAETNNHSKDSAQPKPQGKKVRLLVLNFDKHALLIVYYTAQATSLWQSHGESVFSNSAARLNPH